MKVKEFITLNEEIDVYDDFCEELAICFCGPMKLTSAGKRHFSEVLKYDIDINKSGRFWTAVIHVGEDDDEDKFCFRKLRKAEEFFYSCAGYCADEDYQKWFYDYEEVL